MNDVLKAKKKGDRPVKKISTCAGAFGEIFKEQKRNDRLGLGDRLVVLLRLDEAGKIILEQKVADDTGSDEADLFADTAKVAFALETGTHSAPG